MPVYTYRREDGSTFDIRQPFSDEALELCPETGQKVTRLIQAAGIIFRGSGFYVNDSKKSGNGKAGKTAEKSGAGDKGGEKAAAKKQDEPGRREGRKVSERRRQGRLTLPTGSDRQSNPLCGRFIKSPKSPNLTCTGDLSNRPNHPT